VAALSASLAEAGLRRTLGRLSMTGERLIAWVRLAIAPSMLVLLALGDRSLRAYPLGAWLATGYAVVYSWVAYLVWRAVAARRGSVPAWFAWSLTVGDAGIILVISALTGAARSLYTPILLLVIISLALRFNLRRALAVAACIAVVLAVVILTVPRPDLSAGQRVPAALWWAWLLFFAAVLAGNLSQLAEEALAGRARAEAEARAEHSRLEQERKLRQRLEALEQTRRDFLHAVAHDFRTPITSLEALARVLAKQHEELGPDERRHALELIENHARHVGALLVSVREVALTESLGPDRSLQLADVFFSEMVKAAAGAAGVESSRLVVDISPALSVIRTDPDKTQRILTNLLENAARLSPVGERIEVRLTRHGNALDLAVLDRGPGMSEEVASRAFEKFFGFGERRGSSGLGMWIVAQLADALGGAVQAKPRDGGGLVVVVTQPYIQPAHAGATVEGVKEAVWPAT
jgi:signal transduction histidine kinase